MSFEHRNSYVEQRLIRLALKTAKERGCRYMLACVPALTILHYQQLLCDFGYKVTVPYFKEEAYGADKGLEPILFCADIKYGLILQNEKSAHPAGSKDVQQNFLRARL